MKNIFKALGNVNFDSDRRSHEVILATRRAAREAAINSNAAKWSVPSQSGFWPSPR